MRTLNTCLRRRRCLLWKRFENQILTIFPRICESVLRESILKRAQEKGLASLRRWIFARGQPTSIAPPMTLPMVEGRGGHENRTDRARLGRLARGGDARVLMSPQGRRFDQKLAEPYSRDAISFSSRATTRASTNASPTTSSTTKFPSAITCLLMERWPLSSSPMPSCA